VEKYSYLQADELMVIDSYYSNHQLQ